MIEFQHTIQKNISFSGKGLHTGELTNVTLYPAKINTGILFRRKIDGKEIDIKVDCDWVNDTSRSTNLQYQDVKISTVEHLMAAIMAMGIDNLIIEMDNREIPILDGSAFPFMEILYQAGVVRQNTLRKIVYLNEVVTYQDVENDIEIIAIPSDELELTVMVDYHSEVIGCQYAELKKMSDFEEKFSKARTFCFLHEVETLFHQGLIKGGELSNALVVVENHLRLKDVRQLATVFHQEIRHIPEQGYLNNEPLRYDNEIAKHKTVDLLGDLGLLGVRIKCKIFAKRAGHKSHVAFVKLLKQSIASQLPSFQDKDKKYLFTQSDIKEILPHRYPMLMIDKVLEMTETSIVAIKNVHIDESYFKGHFPEKPIMPGVFQIEALAQTGAVLVLSKQKNKKKLPFLVQIERSTFKSPVYPGDTLFIEVNLIGRMVKGFQRMEGCIFVGDKIVTEIKLTAKIIES
ncbi:MAG: bifunctional UDP-3-O-[3-hydroxymyristoyl] N-acetylglucosamine deacetylase/3-hydroxyacyl-ACP dehydratase [Chitinophagales bacterium]|nr:bifunctional UDP-3-O-[3-hydroxymyristoyl] N-acetylglucosamine deacetylase/3-hydroxyacyl-ACP dehydratase [Chitinophagales bacterium]